MVVLTDTCAILMLLRIAPDMFRDEAYGCVTIKPVIDEIVQKPSFKQQYPWRSEYLHHILPVTSGRLSEGLFDECYDDICEAVNYTSNKKTNRFYAEELSRVDKQIAAALMSLDATLCSGDRNLVHFVETQLEISNCSPLKLVNDWLDAELITWDEQKQSVLSDWVQNENPQPHQEIQRFKKLAKREYPSSAC